MNKNTLALITGALFILSGCATSTKPANKKYTAREKTNMTYCIGMTDTARYIAEQKNKGTPMEDVKNYYVSKPNAKLNIATVDKVYASTFSSVWDYSISFFNECAYNLAAVPAERVNLASYCMQNQLIADVAHTFKSTGKPKDQAYAFFAKFNNDTVNAVIDKTYASNKSRPEIKLEVWNACMAPLSS